jgi:hypothetical protein
MRRPPVGRQKQTWPRGRCSGERKSRRAAVIRAADYGRFRDRLSHSEHHKKRQIYRGVMPVKVALIPVPRSQIRMPCKAIIPLSSACATHLHDPVRGDRAGKVRSSIRVPFHRGDTQADVRPNHWPMRPRDDTMSGRKRTPAPTQPPPLTAAEASVKVAKINRSSAIAVAAIAALATIIAAGIGAWVLHGP